MLNRTASRAFAVLVVFVVSYGVGWLCAGLFRPRLDYAAQHAEKFTPPAYETVGTAQIDPKLLVANTPIATVTYATEEVTILTAPKGWSLCAGTVASRRCVPLDRAVGFIMKNATTWRER
jgi:hypothetical protein